MKSSALAVFVLALTACGSTANQSTGGQPATTSGGTVSQTKYEIIAFKYHPDTRILNIRLSGGYYRFKDVPQSVYDTFLAAGANERAFRDGLDQKFAAQFIHEDPSWKRADQPKDAGL